MRRALFVTIVVGLLAIGSTPARAAGWASIITQMRSTCGADWTESSVTGQVEYLEEQGVSGIERLRAKFRLEGNNSGIQYRSKDLGEWRVGGYQADMDAANTYTGILYEERGRGILANVGTKSTVRPNGEVQVTGSVGDPAEIKAAIKKDGWNEYHITARGNHLVHEINGKVTAELIDDEEAKRAMEGILALQLHAGPPMTVRFKDIRLKVLP